MRSYDLVADLPFALSSYELEERSRRTDDGSWTRVTTTFHLHGGGETGLGEDVGYAEEDQRVQLEAGPVLELEGEWTLRRFAAHLDSLDLFHGREPSFAAYREYRRWALESAALDLLLRQSGRPLHEVLGRTADPVRFVVSPRIGGEAAPVLERLEAYPQARFKLDPEPAWTDELIDALVGTGAVDVLDLKGLYKNTPVDVETDPRLYRRVADAFPEAWLEDPDLDDPEADAALEPHRDRITWDAPIHSVDDVRALRFPPRTLNCKPSRFGTVARLLDFYDHCAREGIGLYGGGQSELGVGRGQIQLLAAIFHPEGSNDVAPLGWDRAGWPRTGLPVPPLDPDPAATGFRRAADA